MGGGAGGAARRTGEAGGRASFVDPGAGPSRAEMSSSSDEEDGELNGFPPPGGGRRRQRVSHRAPPPLSPPLPPRQLRSDAIAKPVHRVHKNIFQNSRRPWMTSPRSSPSSELRMVSLHKHTTKTVGCCVADLAMVKGGLREVGGSIPEGVTPLVPAIHVLLADRRLDAPHALSFVATCSVVQGKAGRKAERPSAQEGNEAGFL